MVSSSPERAIHRWNGKGSVDQMDGWIKVHRKILQSDMYKSLTSKQRDVLIVLLLMANHRSREWEYNGQIFRTKPGQFVTSRSTILNYCAKDVSEQNVKTALKKLEKWEFLTNKSTKTGRLITIVNWGLYQEVPERINQVSNQPVTKHQPSINQQLTPTKNEENEENENNLLPQQQEELKQIEQHYLRQSGRQRLTLRDRKAIQELLQQGFTVNNILNGIDYAFSHFQPQYNGDRIQSFTYCAKVIHGQKKGASVLETSGKDFADDVDDFYENYVKNSYYAPLVKGTYSE